MTDDEGIMAEEKIRELHNVKLYSINVTDDDMQKANATIDGIIKYVESKGFRARVAPEDEYSTYKRLRIWKAVGKDRVHVDSHISVANAARGDWKYWQHLADNSMQKIEEAIMQGPPEPDQEDIYYAQILPLIEQMQTIATEHDIPLIVVAQISDGDFKLSLNIPRHAHEEMKKSAKWWLVKTEKGEPDE